MKKNTVVDATDYLLTVNQLTKQDQTTTSTTTTPPQQKLSSDLIEAFPFLPFALVFALFFGVFTLMVVTKIRSVKAMISALAIALFAASIPAALTYIEHGTQNQTNASPQTEPKLLIVRTDSTAKVIFTWKTDIATLGGIRIWSIKSESDHAKIILSNNRLKTTNHEIILTTLQPDQTYAFELLSNTDWYGNNNMPLIFHLNEK